MFYFVKGWVEDGPGGGFVVGGAGFEAAVEDADEAVAELASMAPSLMHSPAGMYCAFGTACSVLRRLPPLVRDSAGTGSCGPSSR